MRGFYMVSGLGLEPRMTGPKPVVIPFHHPEVNLFHHSV